MGGVHVVEIPSSTSRTIAEAHVVVVAAAAVVGVEALVAAVLAAARSTSTLSSVDE